MNKIPTFLITLLTCASIHAQHSPIISEERALYNTAPDSIKSPNSEHRAALMHLKYGGVLREDRPFTKYFSLYAVPVEQREKVLRLLNVWIHSLVDSVNGGKKFALAKPITDTLYCIDIRDYGWLNETWDIVAQEEPYFQQPWINDEDVLEVEQVLLNSVFAQQDNFISANFIIRADWFIYHVSDTTAQDDIGKEALYYALPYSTLGAPGNLQEFREAWQVDDIGIEALALERGTIVEARRSTVALNQRQITMARTPLGFYYETSDNKSSQDQFNYLDNLQPFGLSNLQRDASEEITVNSLGFQQYFLTASQKVDVIFDNQVIQTDAVVVTQDFDTDTRSLQAGETVFLRSNLLNQATIFVPAQPLVLQNAIEEIDNVTAEIVPSGILRRNALFDIRAEFADPTVARDITQRHDVRVKTARSCVICHAKGLNDVDNQLRRTLRAMVGVRTNVKGFRDNLEHYYMHDFNARIAADRLMYELAVQRVSGWKPNEFATAYRDFMLWYEQPIDVTQAILETGVPQETFLQEIKQTPSGTLAALVAGGKIQREVWETGDSSPFIQSMLILYRGRFINSSPQPQIDRNSFSSQQKPSLFDRVKKPGTSKGYKKRAKEQNRNKLNKQVSPGTISIVKPPVEANASLEIIFETQKLRDNQTGRVIDTVVGIVTDPTPFYAESTGKRIRDLQKGELVYIYNRPHSKSKRFQGVYIYSKPTFKQNLQKSVNFGYVRHDYISRNQIHE